ncbi:MAG TPA: glycoside hydrolase family 44 protein [Verrucomicrobiae bacterium]|nr:glycoside hydrolase family 44 protein [Verrucomicrobiae bacterium]
MKHLGSVLALTTLLVGGSIATAQTENIYIDALASDWQSWSWGGAYYFTNTSPVYSGTASIKISQQPWGALSLYHSSIASNAYRYFQFYIDGGNTGGQLLQVFLIDDNTGTSSTSLNLENYLVGGGGVPSGTWAQVSIPFTAFALTTPTFTRVNVMDRSGTSQPTYYIDQMTLTQYSGLPSHLTVVQAGGTASVVANFDSGLATASATNPANYALQSPNDGNYSSFTTPMGATYDSNRLRAVLGFTNAFINGGQYTLYCNGLTNLGGVATLPGTSGTFGFSNHVIQVNVLASNHVISPLIYGVAWAPSTNYLRDIGASVNRWGGNTVSTYNWLLNTSNAGADWYFENRGGSGYPSNAMQFLSDTTAIGASPLLSVPALPFITKNSTSYSFSVAKYGPQQATDPYNSDAGNGVGTNGQNIVNNPLDSGTTNTVTLQAQWLRSLLSNSVALPFIALDNEMDIWSGTHRDWHPAGMSYDEIWQVFTNYTTMIRATSPTSQILAPVSCCWWYYWNSAAGGGDKAAHGGEDFLPWFLDMVYTNGLQTGQPLLDVLDIHYYPDFPSGTLDPALQLRSTRELWDPTYTSEGWIGSDPWVTQTQPNPYQPEIIPRFQTLIAQHCPGVKLSISEYNWGTDTTLPGALALADVLGIFGVQNLYFATYWTTPATTSPTYQMFKLYRNYDGNGSQFPSTSVFANAGDPNLLTAYAATDPASTGLSVIVVNKNPSNDYLGQLQLTGYAPQPTAAVYQVSAANPTNIVREPDITNAAANMTCVFPAYSTTLLRFTAVVGVNDGIPAWWRIQYFGGNGTSTTSSSCATCDADGTGQDNLFKYITGVDPTNPASVFALGIASVTNQPGRNSLTFGPLAPGRTYTPQFSTNLVSGVWLPLTTYSELSTNGSEVTLTDTNPLPPQEFYRISISQP